MSKVKRGKNDADKRQPDEPAQKPATEKPGIGKSGDAKAARSIAGFDIDAPELSKAIDEGALASGGYPYEKTMKRERFEAELYALQIELLKMQAHIQKTGERVVVVFEGRDSAGKGGCILRFMQHLNPRHAHVVALTKPTEAERGQWYFQRYAVHMPTRGDIVLFDRSWYNRAGVERVMGFCDEEQLADFLREAPEFEGMLVRDGMRLFKLYLTIGREMQLKRFHSRRHDPLKRWKLSDIDIAALSQVGRLHRGPARDVPVHTYRDEPVDRDPGQRPAARPAGSDPGGAVWGRLRRQGRQGGRHDRRQAGRGGTGILLRRIRA